MSKKPIKLTIKERADWERYCGIGVHNVRLVNRANILLALDTSGSRTASGHSTAPGYQPPNRQHRTACLSIHGESGDVFTTQATPDTTCASQNNW